MSSWLFCRKESHLRGLGLLETEVVVVTLLDYSSMREGTASDTSEVAIFARKSTRTHGEVDSVPKGVGAGETDTDAVASGNSSVSSCSASCVNMEWDEERTRR